uniref:accessory gene regulator B family protein n=1 Tax=Agathobacter sp. TaxID=2021311 RepID=UPI0040567043
FQSCYLFSISVFLFFVAVLSPAMQCELYVTYVLFILSAIVILTIGAVNHPNIHWSGEELKASKTAVRWVVLMESGVFFGLSYLGADEKIIVFMAFAVILSSILLLLAKISKSEEVDYEKESGGKESHESHQQGSWK